MLAICGPLAAAPGDDAIAEATAALARGDGIAAEIAGKRALQEGANRSQVAALIGEGELLQGDLGDAREWLEGSDFDSATEGAGLLALARLHVAEGNFDGAFLAFDNLLSRGHETGEVWVDIGRLRYLIGEHHLALEAAYRAVEVDPEEPRALEFLAQLVRDAQGVRASLPIFRQAIDLAPDDAGLLAQYAATLGDAGEHAQSLRVAREVLEIDGDAAVGFYLQAVLAARANEDDLARSLFWRTDGVFDDTAAGLTINGVLEFRAGNYAMAVEHFDDLRRLQPFNPTAALLLARALVANGEANVALDYLNPLAQRSDASNYALILAARAHEQLGERDIAGRYLDRAALVSRIRMDPVPAVLLRNAYGNPFDPEHPAVRLRTMLSEGRVAEARALKGELLDQFPGSVDFLMLAGDVELYAESYQAALSHYRAAAEVRSNWPLVRRMVLATQELGDQAGARRLVADHLADNPQRASAAALLGRMQRDAGNPARAAVLMRHAAQVSGPGDTDPLLLAELAELEALIGREDRALLDARQAHDLQRGNHRVALVLARTIEMGGGDPDRTSVLLAKAAGRGLSRAAPR